MGNIFHGPTTNTQQNSTQTGTSAQQQQTFGTQTGQQLGSNSQQGSFTQSQTPNLPAWYSSFLSTIPTQMQGLSQALTQNAQTPLYGPQQQAAFQNNLNRTQGQASQALTSQLASQGALNSDRAAQQQTQLALGGQNQLSNYLAQVPLQNAQYQQQNLQQLASALNGQAGFTSPISAFGQTTSGVNDQQALSSMLSNLFNTGTSDTTGQTSGTSNTTQSSSVNPNILGGLLGAGLNAGLGVGLKALAK